MPGKNHLENIFEEMSYKTSESESIANVTAWLPNNTISSIIDGKWKNTASSNSIISIKNPELKLALVGSSPDCISKLGLNSKDDVPIETNLSKFKNIDLLTSLCLNVPLWQVSEHAKTGTAITSEDTNILNVEEPGVLVHVDLGSKTFSLASVSTLIKSIPSHPSKKIVFVFRVTSESDAFRLLPVVYEICHLNIGTMKNRPVDIILLKDLTEDIKRSLYHQHGSLAYIEDINCIDSSQKNVAIVSGGFSKRSYGHANHFIVDSSADLQNAVEAISQKIWLTVSGKLHRSLLFVHQPDYKTTIDALELKLNSLRVSESWKRDSDFIKTAVNVDNISLPGVKRLPANGDLRGPTIIYDIGTSSDLVASTSKNIGLGHLLIVLPYRSNTELLSLANNHGSHNDVFLFSNNIMNIKAICKNIKGQDVKVNTCLKNLGSNRHVSKVWGTFTNLQVKGNSKECLNKKNLEELVKKAESSKSKPLLSMPVSETNSDAENFILRVTKPIGLCGIVLVNPVVLDSDTIVELLTNITGAGNTVIVVCVGSKLQDVVLQKCNSKFSGFFLESVAASSDEALTSLAQTGKIELAVVYHNNDGVSLEHSVSFSNFVVTLNGEIDRNLLVTKKVLHM